MASAGAGPGLNPKADPLSFLSPIPGSPATTPGIQPPPYVPLTGGFCNGIPYPALQGMVVYQQASPIPKASPPGTPGWQPARPPNAAGSNPGVATALPAVTVFNNTPQSWYIRKTGSDFNGGSSPTVLASGSDGSYIPATNGAIFTSTSAGFTSALQGHWIQWVTGGIAYFAQILQVVNGTTLRIRPEVRYAFSAVPGGTAMPYVIGGAWQTLNMAFGVIYNTATASHGNRNSRAAPLAPGDTVYIGGGTYREAFLTNQNGLPGNPITIWGDIDGSHTGDIGEVIFTAWVNGDSAPPVSSASPFLQAGASGTSAGAVGIRWVNLTVLAYGTAINALAIWWSFLNCTIFSQTGAAISWAMPGSAELANDGLFLSGLGAAPLVDGCTLIAGSEVFLFSEAPGNLNFLQLPPTTKTYDVNGIIRNSILFGFGGTSLFISGANGTSLHAPAGLRIYNSVLVGVITAQGSPPAALDIPTEVHGCIVMGSISSAALGSILESYNALYSSTSGSSRSLVSIGIGSSGSQAFGFPTNAPQEYAPMLDFGREFKLSGVLRRHFFSPSVGSVLAGFGFQPAAPPGFAGLVTGYAVPAAPLQTAAYPNAATYPTLAPTSTDFMGRYRATESGLIIPGALPLTSPGAIEVHDSATENNAVFQTVPPSGQLIGAGDQEVRIPVDAVANTISLSIMYDSNYQGLPPIVQLVTANEIGVQQQTQQAPFAAPGIWNTLTFSPFTPTAPGFVLLRIISQDLSGVSNVNFDTLAVA